jgi:hypothetical protein
LAALASRAAHNLSIATGYLEAKLLAVSLLEALALVTGGDAPLSLFMGDIAHDGESLATMEKFLPPAPRPAWLDVDHPVFQLLSVGRVEESNFDLRNSPLAEFLYASLEPAAREALLPRMHEFFAATLWPEAYLDLWPRALTQAVFHACAQIVSTRRDALEARARR